jgi:hypothetical protein
MLTEAVVQKPGASVTSLRISMVYAKVPSLSLSLSTPEGKHTVCLAKKEAISKDYTI